MDGGSLSKETRSDRPNRDCNLKQKNEKVTKSNDVGPDGLCVYDDFHSLWR